MGGRGNQSFKTRSNTAPRIAENGQPGEEVTLILELKVLADLGLVGFPNAGKSTFLSRISAARPKIADYPFTTLNPNLGITLHKGISFATADIPGIIEGASEGKGLGYQFLKHIERTRVLLHLVDPSGFDGMDAAESVKVIEAELKTFDKNLAKKPRIIAINKSDVEGAQEAYEQIKRNLKSIKSCSCPPLTETACRRCWTKWSNPVRHPGGSGQTARKTAVVHKVDPIFTITTDDAGARIAGKKWKIPLK